MPGAVLGTSPQEKTPGVHVLQHSFSLALPGL